jgi:hypothetical protein
MGKRVGFTLVSNLTGNKKTRDGSRGFSDQARIDLAVAKDW